MGKTRQQNGRVGRADAEAAQDVPKARTAPDKTAIERQIAATGRQIDQLAYALYGLKDEEIRIVEGG